MNGYWKWNGMEKERDLLIFNHGLFNLYCIFLIFLLIVDRS